MFTKHVSFSDGKLILCVRACARARFCYVHDFTSYSVYCSSLLSSATPYCFEFKTPCNLRCNLLLTLSDPTSDLVRQYDFPALLRCRKTFDTVFVAFVRPLSEPVRRVSLCSTDVSQQIAQVVLFLYLHVFLF
jgi:hypothetical protein